MSQNRGIEYEVKKQLSAIDEPVFCSYKCKTRMHQKFINLYEES